MIPIVLFAVLGLAVGSFLNVCCDRLPLKQSIVKPPSHCGSCNQRIRLRDLVPVFSYLWLRGRCHYCGSRIPFRVPVVELSTAILFGLVAWQYSLTLQLLMILIYACIFLMVFVIDLEHGLILDRVVYPAMAVALVFSFFWGGFGEWWPRLGIATSLLGGLSGFILMLIPYLISRGGMGGGDVKLAGLIGLSAGFPLIFLALAIAIIAGGIVAIMLLLLRIRTRKQAIPFGPFLASAAIVTLIWGHPLATWLVSLA